MIGMGLTDVPVRGDEGRLLRYCMEGAHAGDAYLKACPGYALIQHCHEQINGLNHIAVLDGMDRPADLATTTANYFKKIAFTLVGSLTDIKPSWEIKTYNPRFAHQADILSKLSTHWYTATNADQRGVGNAIRYALVSGCGYVHLKWDPTYGNGGSIMGEIIAEAIDPRDLLPLRVNSFDTIQDCEAVIIRQETTVNAARRLYPNKRYLIRGERSPDEGSPIGSTRFGRMYQELNQNLGSPFHDVFWPDRAKNQLGLQSTLDIFTMYTKDDSVNEQSVPVEMGPFKDDPDWNKPDGLLSAFTRSPRIPATNWAYLVQPGEPLYPRGRRVIFTRAGILEDMPNPYWHGKFPVCKLTLDLWPTTFLGVAPMWDLLSLQSSLNWNLRVRDDHNAQVARPTVIGNSASVGHGELNAIDTRKAGLKILYNPMGKPPEIIPPPPLDISIEETIKDTISKMEDLAGCVNTDGIQDKDQIPNTETIERLIETQSHLVRARSRAIEVFMRDMAYMMGYNFAQFYTQQMRFYILGPAGQTPEDFNFDPGDLLPDYVHAGDFDDFGNVTSAALVRGTMPKFNRAQEVMHQMAYNIAPGSLLNASAQTRKLLFLQLWRTQAIDPWTMAEVLDIPNYGEPPSGAVSIPDRIAAARAMGLMMDPNAQAGRPPTAQTMPHIASTGHGPVVAESR